MVDVKAGGKNVSMNQYDVIGDIHGSFPQLMELIRTLGYDEATGSHPEGRQLVFVGDLIDRKPDQWAVIECVRRYVRAGNAHIVMGNHEFNALAWDTHTADGIDWCRPHNEKNREQHEAFLKFLTDEQRREALEWFLSIPLWLELPGLNVVHACWDQEAMDRIRATLGGPYLRGDHDIQEASLEGNSLYEDIETILKGPEILLDDLGLPPYFDKGDHVRHKARANWWHRKRNTQRQLINIPAGTMTALEPSTPYPDLDDTREFSMHVPNYHGDVPVIFGHYWRQWSDEDDWQEGAHIGWERGRLCVDFSAGKEGPLVAYRFSEGETEFHPRNFVAIHQAS
jgi:hypothetical protein